MLSARQSPGPPACSTSARPSGTRPSAGFSGGAAAALRLAVDFAGAGSFSSGCDVPLVDASLRSAIGITFGPGGVTTALPLGRRVSPSSTMAWSARAPASATHSRRPGRSTRPSSPNRGRSTICNAARLCCEPSHGTDQGRFPPDPNPTAPCNSRNTSRSRTNPRRCPGCLRAWPGRRAPPGCPRRCAERG